MVIYAYEKKKKITCNSMYLKNKIIEQNGIINRNLDT